jgi:hypothetical protein
MSASGLVKDNQLDFDRVVDLQEHLEHLDIDEDVAKSLSLPIKVPKQPKSKSKSPYHTLVANALVKCYGLKLVQRGKSKAPSKIKMREEWVASNPRPKGESKRDTRTAFDVVFNSLPKHTKSNTYTLQAVTEKRKLPHVYTDGEKVLVVDSYMPEFVAAHPKRDAVAYREALLDPTGTKFDDLVKTLELGSGKYRVEEFYNATAVDMVVHESGSGPEARIVFQPVREVPDLDSGGCKVCGTSDHVKNKGSYWTCEKCK